MRKFSANYIFPVSQPPIKNGIIVLNDDDSIQEIINPEGNFKEYANLEHHNGIIVPGFVNAHCHLELSFLKGKIKEKSGISSFVEQLKNERKVEEKTISEAIQKWDSLMYDYGIVAVGDISNDESSFPIKANSKIHYHTFIEVFGTNSKNINNILNQSENLLKIAEKKYNLSCSISPHSAYSLHPDLFKSLKKIIKQDSIASVHNQESIEENELFLQMQGKLFEKLKKWGANPEKWYEFPKSSMEIILENLPANSNKLMVHNTFSRKAEIIEACKNYKNIYWILCPNSNLFIENTLPAIYDFPEDSCIAIGTDSLASNNRLSILEEIKTIQENFSDITLNQLIKFSTLNGAKALKIEKTFGSFDIGKKPGIILLENINLQKMKFRKESSARRLV